MDQERQAELASALPYLQESGGRLFPEVPVLMVAWGPSTNTVQKAGTTSRDRANGRKRTDGWRPWASLQVHTADICPHLAGRPLGLFWWGLIPKELCAVPQLSLCRTFCVFPEHSSTDAPATSLHSSIETGVASPSPPTDYTGSLHNEFYRIKNGFFVCVSPGDLRDRR